MYLNTKLVANICIENVSYIYIYIVCVCAMGECTGGRHQGPSV